MSQYTDTSPLIISERRSVNTVPPNVEWWERPKEVTLNPGTLFKYLTPQNRLIRNFRKARECTAFLE